MAKFAKFCQEQSAMESLVYSRLPPKLDHEPASTYIRDMRVGLSGVMFDEHKQELTHHCPGNHSKIHAFK